MAELERFDYYPASDKLRPQDDGEYVTYASALELLGEVEAERDRERAAKEHAKQGNEQYSAELARLQNEVSRLERNVDSLVVEGRRERDRAEAAEATIQRVREERDELISAVKQWRNATESRLRLLDSRGEAAKAMLKPDADLMAILERVGG